MTTGTSVVTAGSSVPRQFDLSTTYLGLRLRSPLVASSGFNRRIFVNKRKYIK